MSHQKIDEMCHVEETMSPHFKCIWVSIYTTFCMKRCRFPSSFGMIIRVLVCGIHLLSSTQLIKRQYIFVTGINENKIMVIRKNFASFATVYFFSQMTVLTKFPRPKISSMMTFR